jgi:hypothetical protein
MHFVEIVWRFPWWPVDGPNRVSHRRRAKTVPHGRRFLTTPT